MDIHPYGIQSRSKFASSYIFMENDKIMPLTNLFQHLISAEILSEWKIEFILPYFRGQNKALSSDMTKPICHLIGHKFSQFQALHSHFVKRKLKIS